MKTRLHLLLALAVVFSAAAALAGIRIQYFVGYGLYPPDGPFTPDTTSTTPGTGLLAVNGSHQVLVQLVYAGADNINNGLFTYISPGSDCIGGDDVVVDSRILEAGVDGVDEWGYTATPPPPFVLNWATPGFFFIRVHQGAHACPPIPATHWTYDSPLFTLEDLSWGVPDPKADALATVIYIETGSETVPTNGVALDQLYYFCMSCPWWMPDEPANPEIHYADFDPATAGLDLQVPYSYSLNAVYGAATRLPGGGWDWQLLSEGTDYTVSDDIVTLLSTGAGLPPFRIVRLGLIRQF